MNALLLTLLVALLAGAAVAPAPVVRGDLVRLARRAGGRRAATVRAVDLVEAHTAALDLRGVAS